MTVATDESPHSQKSCFLDGPLVIEEGLGSPTRQSKTQQKENSQSTEDTGDKLVCGKCSAQFSLHDIQLFVQHKEEECIGSLTASLVNRIQEASTAAARSSYRIPTPQQGELYIKFCIQNSPVASK